MNKKGQVILALILVMTVALAIGLSVIQKSLVDVSTSTKVEQSSRAFSAAEAGVERALQVGPTDVKFPENDSSAKVTDTGLIPAVPANAQQEPLIYPPLSKEEIAQVWLSDPAANLPSCTLTDPAKPKPVCYKQTTLDIYWGNSTQDKAALELTLIYHDGSKYLSKKRYLDHTIVRNPANNFQQVPCQGYVVGSINFQCKETIGDLNPPTDTPLPSALMLLRARLLYNSSSQPFAVQPPPSAICGADCSLPPQARVLVSTGVSGETQRQVQVFQLNNVVPHWFDYAIFSAGEISK